MSSFLDQFSVFNISSEHPRTQLMILATGLIADRVAETVDFAMQHFSPSTQCDEEPEKRATFNAFVETVITRAQITTPVIVTLLVYLDRAKPHLRIALAEWKLERVFLGAVIAASKVRSLTIAWTSAMLTHEFST